jgi:Dienelactone hydrolase and related enzymes
MASRIINGKTLLEKTLSDLSAAIDYITTRSEVDKKRIGFIGHSYGGRMACILPAYDNRVKVSVANCYARQLKKSLDINTKTRIPMELVIPNILKYGDFSDLLKLSNNCNILLSISKKDKWSQDATEIYQKAKKFFKKKNLHLKKWSSGHSFSKKMRMYSYKYIEKFI